MLIDTLGFVAHTFALSTQIRGKGNLCELEAGLVCIVKSCLKKRRKKRKEREGVGRETVINEWVREEDEKISLKRNNGKCGSCTFRGYPQELTFERKGDWRFLTLAFQPFHIQASQALLQVPVG